MTLRSLEIFNAVVETGSMSKAAQKLDITQSSVSQVIIDIEKEYDVILFERLNHGLKLTPSGEEMVKYVKNILLLNDELESALKHESKNLRIRLGATVTVGSTVMKGIVMDLEKQYPDVEHTVFVANTHIIEEMLLNNELDIGLVEGIIDSQDLVVKMAIYDRLVLICSPKHRFYGKDTVSINDLAGEKLILRENGSGTRAQLMEELKNHSITPNIAWNCYTHEAIISAVESNLGISVISQRLVKDLVSKGQLWACDISDADFNRSFKLAYHKDKYFTNTMKSFVQICYNYGRLSEPIEPMK
ncbi:MAG: LysR family transcriptional regulator [Bacillales bacterium]|nr:LysR family transcriptional regulator [Bacillales bacterium]